jgi:cytochrome c oxidase cbb3-type subunit 3
MQGQELTDEMLQLMAAVPDRVSTGRRLFEQLCVVCHGNQGEGNVGPNLTDEYWIHGGGPLQIHGTVTNGVLEKGMAAWGSQLGPHRVQQVVAYVLTIKGTNVPGKPPQGERADAPAGDPASVAPPEVVPAEKAKRDPGAELGERLPAIPRETPDTAERLGSP